MKRLKMLLGALGQLLRGCGSFGPWTGEGAREPWLRCADFGPGARNHCAACACANAVLLLGGSVDRGDLCRRAYEAIGPGPVLGPRRLRRFLAREGYGPVLPLGDLESLCAALERGQPCLLLLAQRPWSWHWVLARAYRREGRSLLLEIADGWNTGSRSLCPTPEAPWLGAWALSLPPKKA